MGHSDPASTVPFLATREMFAIKGDPAQELAEAFIAANMPIAGPCST